MFTCFYAPDFPVQAVLRSRPEYHTISLNRIPVAVLDGSAATQRVFALNQPARQKGARPGMTKVELDVCEQMLVHKRSTALEKSAQAALLDCAHCFSPRVEAVADGIVVADVSGTERLFGPAQKLARTISIGGNKFGFELHIGIAANPDTAVHVARGYPGNTVVDPGEEAARLASLPIDVLPATSEMLQILDAWGIRNCQALTALPSLALVERMGQAGLHLQQLACGEVKRTLVPVEPALEFIETFEFDDSVGTLDGISFILNRLIQQLCARLSARSLAASEIKLTLSFDVRDVNSGKKGEVYERAWKLPVTTQNSKTIFKLIHLDLEGVSQAAPVQAITMEAVPAKKRFTQHSFFIPAGPAPEELEITLKRIRGLVGERDQNGVERVGSPTILDSHKPDSFEVSSALTDSIQSQYRKSRSAPCIALRIYRPVFPATVEVSSDRPVAVSFSKKHLRVLAASGPWRSSGHWWSDSQAWVRDEWDIALRTKEGIGLYRIYFDVIQEKWFVEGMFD